MIEFRSIYVNADCHPEETMSLYRNAEQQLDSFLRKGIENYTKSRNYDFGAENRGNVSRLSPYISHRLMLEYDAIKAALTLYPFSKIEKFIEEIFWRVYWRGWLEQRPSVWKAFRNYPKPTSDDLNYLSAVNAVSYTHLTLPTILLV